MNKKVLTKIKSASIKMALLGLAGLSLANAINPTLNSLEIAKEVRNSTEYVQIVDSKFKEINDMYGFLKNDGILDNFNHVIKTEASKESSTAFQNLDLNSGTYTCEVMMRVDSKTNMLDINTMTSFSGLLAKTLNLNTSDDSMYTEMVLGHELGHCNFAKIDAPFQLTGSFENNALINEVYGNTSLSVQVNYGGGVESLTGVEYLLNEAYAESFATVAMIKKYNGSEKVQSFLKKQEALRNFQAAVDSPHIYVVNGYDIGDAIKGLNNPEKIKEILEAETINDLSGMILENANNTFLNGITRANADKLDYFLSSDLLVEQGMSAIGVESLYMPQKSSAFTKTLIDGADKVNLTVKEISNYGSMDGIEKDAFNEKARSIKIDVQNVLYGKDFSQKIDTATDILKNLVAENKEAVGDLHTGEDAVQKIGEDFGLSMKDLKVLKKEFEQRDKHREEIIATQKTMHSFKTEKPYGL